MEKLTVHLSGFLVKPPKIRDDGTVDIMFKITTPIHLPKDIRPISDRSTVLVRVSQKAWLKGQKKIKDNKR